MTSAAHPAALVFDPFQFAKFPEKGMLS